jgi:hypothetical protein
MSKHPKTANRAHAPISKPLKLQMQSAPRAIRKILLAANDSYAEYRRSGFKGSWWNHRRGSEEASS